MRPGLGAALSHRSRVQLAALLKVQARLSLREPYGVGLGLGFPVVLLVLFGVISRHVPGNVAGSGLTVIDLYIPTIMVISFIAIAIFKGPWRIESLRSCCCSWGWRRRGRAGPTCPRKTLRPG